MPDYRLGMIRYTNVAPLIHTLREGTDWQGGASPTEMNRALLEERVDLANISAIEFIRNADQLEALPDFSVSVLGPVYSVNVFSKRPWKHLDGASIAVTAQSATSVALLQLLLKMEGMCAELTVVEGPAMELLSSGYDAVLRIGDDALKEWFACVGPFGDQDSMGSLQPRAKGVEIIDLSMLWYEKTQLPFVFAVWAHKKRNRPPEHLLHQLRQARRYGLGHLDEVAHTHARRLELPACIVQHYLWNFRYHLELADRQGLFHFAKQVDPAHLPLCFSA